MAKALDYRWDLPYAPQAMFEQGIRRDYIEAQAKTLSHHDLTLKSLVDGPDGGSAIAEYDIETDLPSWAKKMFPARSHVTETRQWPAPAADGSRSYTFIVKIDQVPVEIKGKVDLALTPDGTTLNTVHVDLKAGIPIVGGKLEELVAKDLSATIEGEAAFIQNWMRTQV